MIAASGRIKTAALNPYDSKEVRERVTEERTTVGYTEVLESW